MTRSIGPLLTAETLAAMQTALAAGQLEWQGSLDLGRSSAAVPIDADGFVFAGLRHPWPAALKERTVYHRVGDGFTAVQRFGGALIKLVPTSWGAPTFEIDGIKMLPTAQVSPWEDAGRKVALVQPSGKRILDTCGGLGYFAAWCLAGGAAAVHSVEKNVDVLWLRGLNPWSPDPDEASAGGRLLLEHADIVERIATLPDASFSAALHDPPRFGIAGELYSLSFYRELGRVLKPGGRLFHYVGSPNAKTSGRDVPGEVIRRLQQAGFDADRAMDGVLATRRGGPGLRR